MSSLIKTVILKVDPVSPDGETIRSCAAKLKDGSLVAFPTETVYGIAANLFDKDAIARLYKVKKRPLDKPFTVHISDIRTMEEMGCVVTKKVRELIDKYWPGPLTIIVKDKNGKPTGFRMPANKIAISLIRAAGVPIVAPSANLSGNVPPVTADDVLKDMNGLIDIVIDGGRTEVGLESTVIDMIANPPKVLREGAIKSEELLGKE